MSLKLGDKLDNLTAALEIRDESCYSIHEIVRSKQTHSDHPPPTNKIRKQDFYAIDERTRKPRKVARIASPLILIKATIK